MEVIYVLIPFWKLMRNCLNIFWRSLSFAFSGLSKNRCSEFEPCSAKTCYISKPMFVQGWLDILNYVFTPNSRDNYHEPIHTQ